MVDEGQELADFFAAYEGTALRWGDLQSDAAAANRVFKENHDLQTAA
jgi:hypothetical protein